MNSSDYVQYVPVLGTQSTVPVPTGTSKKKTSEYLPCNQHHTTVTKLSILQLYPVSRICTGFNADPDLAFQVIVDPDPGF